MLDHYRSAVLLAVAAVVLLIAGGPSKAALAGAGLAFVGAAITRAVDIARERRQEATQEEARRRADLDETRRLAYAALVAPTAPAAPELVATLVNALAHHGSAVDPDVAAGQIATVVNGADHSPERGLAASRIQRITAELDHPQKPGYFALQPGRPGTTVRPAP